MYLRMHTILILDIEAVSILLDFTRYLKIHHNIVISNLARLYLTKLVISYSKTWDTNIFHCTYLGRLPIFT